MRGDAPDVLIVDAYPDAAESTRDVLALFGIRARTAASCADAVAIARITPLMVVVTATRLPDGDGCKLAALMRTALAPSVAVIAIDSDQQSEVGTFTEWFLKPAEPRQLAAAVRRHLPRSIGLSV